MYVQRRLKKRTIYKRVKIIRTEILQTPRWRTFSRNILEEYSWEYCRWMPYTIPPSKLKIAFNNCWKVLNVQIFATVFWFLSHLFWYYFSSSCPLVLTMQPIPSHAPSCHHHLFYPHFLLPDLTFCPLYLSRFIPLNPNLSHLSISLSQLRSTGSCYIPNDRRSLPSTVRREVETSIRCKVSEWVSQWVCL